MLNKTQVAMISVISNTLLTVGKVIVGLATGAVSIISEGIHSGIDLIAALIALFAVREASKPADEKHTYGHGKIENVSGTIEALLIFVAAIWIITEAVHKIMSGAEGGSYGLGMAIMAGSAVINTVVSTLLMRVAKRTDSIALEADALHLRTDVFTSLGVFAGLLLIQITGWAVLDPIVALIVALFILRSAYKLTKEAFMPLVDESLPQKEYEVILAVLDNYAEGYVEFHELRTRRSGADRYIDLHLVVPQYKSVGEVHDLCDKIEEEIARRLSGAKVLIHTEPCGEKKESCSCEDCISSTGESKE